MGNSVSFFLPTRKGSQRVINKNTKRFAWYEGGLLENKLLQLSSAKLIDKIILSTNDEVCIEIAEKLLDKIPNLVIDVRPEELCLDTTNLKDLIKYVPTITDSSHILWGHVTTPLFGGADYDNAIQAYHKALTEGYDSLITVNELRNFLLNKEGRVVNNTTSLPWPRTQDLETLYEINHAVFMTSREIYEEQSNRVGSKPHLLSTDKIKSFDVDWEEDFKIAEILYEKYYGL